MHQLTDEEDPLDDLDLEEGPLLNRCSHARTRLRQLRGVRSPGRLEVFDGVCR